MIAMDSEDRAKLEKVLKLSEESNRMVHKLYRSWWWGRVGTFLYWIVIIGVAFGALYFLQPYVDKLKSVYGGIVNNLDTVQKVGSALNGALK